MKKIITISCLLLVTLAGIAQSPAKQRNSYSFVPQYLINRGIRIDVDKHIKGRHYLQLCPQFYLSEKDPGSFANVDNEFTLLLGGGVNIYHRIYATEDPSTYGFYMSYGLTYNYFDIDYIDYSGEYQKSANGDIHKVGGDLILGYNAFITDAFSLDIYAGLGTRLSTIDSHGADTDRFNDAWWGYNYTGNLMHTGFRLCIHL